MTEIEVENPLQSMDKAGLWSNAIIDLVELALDKYLFGTRQGIMGLINQQKTHTRSIHKENMSNLPAFFETLVCDDMAHNQSWVELSCPPNVQMESSSKQNSLLLH
jgi:hypothetical protein